MDIRHGICLNKPPNETTIEHFSKDKDSRPLSDKPYPSKEEKYFPSRMKAASMFLAIAGFGCLVLFIRQKKQAKKRPEIPWRLMLKCKPADLPISSHKPKKTSFDLSIRFLPSEPSKTLNLKEIETLLKELIEGTSGEIYGDLDVLFTETVQLAHQSSRDCTEDEEVSPLFFSFINNYLTDPIISECTEDKEVSPFGARSSDLINTLFKQPILSEYTVTFLSKVSDLESCHFIKPFDCDQSPVHPIALNDGIEINIPLVNSNEGTDIFPNLEQTLNPAIDPDFDRMIESYIMDIVSQHTLSIFEETGNVEDIKRSSPEPTPDSAIDSEFDRFIESFIMDIVSLHATYIFEENGIIDIKRSPSSTPSEINSETIQDGNINLNLNSNQTYPFPIAMIDTEKDFKIENPLVNSYEKSTDVLSLEEPIPDLSIDPEFRRFIESLDWDTVAQQTAPTVEKTGNVDIKSPYNFPTSESSDQKLPDAKCNLNLKDYGHADEEFVINSHAPIKNNNLSSDIPNKNSGFVLNPWPIGKTMVGDVAIYHPTWQPPILASRPKIPVPDIRKKLKLKPKWDFQVQKREQKSFKNKPTLKLDPKKFLDELTPGGRDKVKHNIMEESENAPEPSSARKKLSFSEEVEVKMLFSRRKFPFLPKAICKLMKIRIFEDIIPLKGDADGKAFKHLKTTKKRTSLLLDIPSRKFQSNITIAASEV